MIKKYYTLLIASEPSHINRSFKVSQFIMNLVLILILVIIFFAYIGFSYQLNISKHANEFNNLKEFENSVVDIIHNQIKFRESSDSVIVREIHNLINNQVSRFSFLAPVDGFVTQSINIDNNHNGIDIASEKGEIILASQDGLIIFSGYKGDLGNTLIISHPYNYYTIYSHCDSLLIKGRQRVSKGDIIATVGKTGKATAPHLHFEIWYNDSIIDPRNIINKYGDLDVSAE